MAVLPTETVCGMHQLKFGAIFILCIQVVYVILFVIFARYGDDALPTNEIGNSQESEIDIYPMFMDVHVMIFVGFGFLMTFLKRYTFGGIAFNFLVSAMVVQWALLSNGFYSLDGNHKIPITLSSLLAADIAAAAVLISMGAVLGRTSYIQLLIMGLLEIVLYSANNYLAETMWKVTDAGASMFVHAFGAYFGLAVSFVLNFRRPDDEEKDFESSYTSDTFAMIGSLFLWMFWPSFNAGEVTGDSQYRAIINTYISISACCVTTFVLSYVFNPDRKFNMVHIQNSTLAGGVAIGASADLMIQPWGAALVGTIAAFVSVIGYIIITPCITKNLRTPDTCGVHNLHGMPGVLGGIVGAIMAAIASEEMYHLSLYQHYPAMAPTNSSDMHDLIAPPGDGRAAWQQAGFQLVALVVTVGLAIVGGLLTGLLLKLKVFNPDPELQTNKDDNFWIIEEGKAAE